MMCKERCRVTTRENPPTNTRDDAVDHPNSGLPIYYYLFFECVRARAMRVKKLFTQPIQRASKINISSSRGATRFDRARGVCDLGNGLYRQMHSKGIWYIPREQCLRRPTTTYLKSNGSIHHTHTRRDNNIQREKELRWRRRRCPVKERVVVT